MRALLIVATAKSIEALLLGRKTLPGRSGGSLFERPMHAFMAAILLWFAWLDPFGEDAEGDPPDGQA